MAVDVDVVRRRRFTIEQYEQMVATGILAQDDRVELIDGEIVEMSPIGNPHIGAVMNLTHLLVPRVGEDARVLVQGPVRVPPRSVPQPDLAVVRRRSYKRQGATPADVLLIIEVADTSLVYDRTVKLPLYARAGIREYWIVDVNTETVDVYRSPSGGPFAERRTYAAGQSFLPSAFPNVSIAVDEIFV